MGEEGPSGEAGDNGLPGRDGSHGKESMNLAPPLEEPCIVRILEKREEFIMQFCLTDLPSRSSGTARTARLEGTTGTKGPGRRATKGTHRHNSSNHNQMVPEILFAFPSK